MKNIKLNDRNIAFLEGEITSLRFEDMQTSKPAAKFDLVSYHASKPTKDETTGKLRVKYYPCSMGVTFYGKAAEKIHRKFKNGNHVLVEGHIRGHGSGFKKLIGVHIDLSLDCIVGVPDEDILVKPIDPEDGETTDE